MTFSTKLGKWYLHGPKAPFRDFPRQVRPVGGFARPMWTCPRCWGTSPLFHVRTFDRCPVCWVPGYPVSKEPAA